MHSCVLSLTSVLDEDDGQGQAPAPGRETRYPLYTRLGTSHGRSGPVWEVSPTPGFDPRTVRLVAISYIHYGLPDPPNDTYNYQNHLSIVCTL
jgi:hypothetical protein